MRIERVSLFYPKAILKFDKNNMGINDRFINHFRVVSSSMLFSIEVFIVRIDKWIYLECEFC